MKKLLLSILLVPNLWSFQQSTNFLDPDEFWRYGVALSILSTYGTNIMGATESAFEIGQTQEGSSGEIADVFKMIFKWDKKTFYQGDSFKIDWYWMLDIGRFEMRETNVGDGANDTIGLTPTFRYSYEFSWAKPYFEVGIGIYLIADTNYLGRELNTHFQFGDFLTLGTYLGKEKRWHVAYKFFHHSNGEITHPNQGFGMELVSIGYRY